MKTLAALILLAPIAIAAAAPNDRQRDGCKTQTAKLAEAIIKYRKNFKLDDFYVNDEKGVGQRVSNYMVHAANTSTLTERELATIGNTYCLSQF